MAGAAFPPARASALAGNARSEPALLQDRPVSRVDSSHFFISQTLDFQGRPAGNEAIRVILGGNPAIGGAQIRVGNVSLDAQNDVGIVRFGLDMSGANAAELGLAEPENVRHLFQIAHLVRRHRTIGLGDMEEPVQHIFQNGRLAAETPRQPAAITVKAQRGLGGQLEGPVERFSPFGWRFEDFVESADFRAGDDAVGLGHLGAKPDQRHGEIGILDIVLGCAFIAPITFEEAVTALQPICQPSPETHFSALRGVI